MAPAQPDLIRIGRDRRGRLMLGVGDIKWSREATVQHYAQVAFYTILLEEICRAEGIDAVRRDALGVAVDARLARAQARSRSTAYRHHVEEFLRADLPRVASARPRRPRGTCARAAPSCSFFHHCRAEAEPAPTTCRASSA